MKNKLRSLTALLAVVLCVSVFSIPAYAQSSEPADRTGGRRNRRAGTGHPEPVYPKGTGTVLDNATKVRTKRVLYHCDPGRKRILSGD